MQRLLEGDICLKPDTYKKIREKYLLSIEIRFSCSEYILLQYESLIG